MVFHLSTNSRWMGRQFHLDQWTLYRFGTSKRTDLFHFGPHLNKDLLGSRSEQILNARDW
jgi:hypothetical protein